MGLMDAANRRGRRGDVLKELILQACGSGRYRGSIEELVPLTKDPFFVVPLAVVLAKLLMSPAAPRGYPAMRSRPISLSPGATARLRAWTTPFDEGTARWMRISVTGLTCPTIISMGSGKHSLTRKSCGDQSADLSCGLLPQLQIDPRKAAIVCIHPADPEACRAGHNWARDRGD